jgi:hypothetical protein
LKTSVKSPSKQNKNLMILHVAIELMIMLRISILHNS